MNIFIYRMKGIKAIYNFQNITNDGKSKEKVNFKFKDEY